MRKIRKNGAREMVRGVKEEQEEGECVRMDERSKGEGK